MMLNGSPGAWITGIGVAPGGASQSASPGPSSAILRAAVSIAACAASWNRIGAPQSAIIAESCSGVADGASGAATQPARSAPSITTAYSSEVAARIATALPRATPSRWSAAATRSIPASSAP